MAADVSAVARAAADRAGASDATCVEGYAATYRDAPRGAPPDVREVCVGSALASSASARRAGPVVVCVGAYATRRTRVRPATVLSVMIWRILLTHAASRVAYSARLAYRERRWIGVVAFVRHALMPPRGAS